jgi:hypothetical protein
MGRRGGRLGGRMVDRGKIGDALCMGFLCPDPGLDQVERLVRFRCACQGDDVTSPSDSGPRLLQKAACSPTPRIH